MNTQTARLRVKTWICAAVVVFSNVFGNFFMKRGMPAELATPLEYITVLFRPWVSVGVLLLMHTLNVLNFEYVARYWPVLLIALGAWLLYLRVTAPGGAQNGARDPLWGRSDERR